MSTVTWEKLMSKKKHIYVINVSELYILDLTVRFSLTSEFGNFVITLIIYNKVSCFCFAGASISLTKCLCSYHHI